jgi:hypothetical protein
MELHQTVFFGLAVVLLFSVVHSSFAAYTVGVKPGDWMKYQVTLSWTGSEPDTSDFGELGEAEYVKGEVLAVDGTGVTVKMSMHLKNGSDIEQRLVGNVATGEGNLTVFIVPSGMQKNDVFPGMMFGDDAATFMVADTVSRSYCGASRTVNVYSLSMPPTSGFSAAISAYWDQATGVLAELSMSMSMAEQSMSMKVLASETNMWSSGFLGFNLSSDPMMNILIPVIAIAAVAACVVVVALILVRRSHRAAASVPMPPPASATAQ